jgi:hypothetical protein
VASRAPLLIPVPGPVAMAFTAARGWHFLDSVPPAWWLEDQEALTDAPLRPVTVLADVRASRQARTSCRPGSGPCRRRHEHASARRAG